MEEFLRNYGQWIFVGVMFLVMMRLHGSGMGCCGGGHKQAADKKADGAKQDEKKGSGGASCH